MTAGEFHNRKRPQRHAKRPTLLTVQRHSLHRQLYSFSWNSSYAGKFDHELRTWKIHALLIINAPSPKTQAEKETPQKRLRPKTSAQKKKEKTMKSARLKNNGEVLQVDAKTLSPVLQYIGFELTHVSATSMEGAFVVSERSSQADGILNGGVASVIAESLGSLGTFLAADGQRVVGVELSITHLQQAPIGTEIQVKATPLVVNSNLQVWETRFVAPRFCDDVSEEAKALPEGLIAVAKLTGTVYSSKSPEKPENAPPQLSKL